jgi:hypothetical protein
MSIAFRSHTRLPATATAGRSSEGFTEYQLPASSTLCFAKRCLAVLPPGLMQALGRGHDCDDQGVRQGDQKSDGDGVPRDTSADKGLLGLGTSRHIC